MTSRSAARRLLAADGAGCAAAVVAMLASKRLACAVNPSLRARWPVVVGLGATSVFLIAGSRRLTDQVLHGAAIVNVGWVAVCLLALRGSPSPRGAAVLMGTAAFDCIAAIAQWRARSAG